MEDSTTTDESPGEAIDRGVDALGAAASRLDGQRSIAGDDLERIKAKLEEARIAIEESKRRLDATLEEAARTIEAPGPSIPE